MSKLVAENSTPRALWAVAIEEYAAAQHGAQLAPNSVALQAKRLRAAAQQLSAAPWDTTRDDLERYLGSHPGSTKTVRAVRQTLRSFYSWAVQAGRLSSTPAPAATPTSHYKLTARWQDALIAFEAAQALQGIAESTLAKRLKHVRRLAGYVELTPWQVSADDLTEWLAAMVCALSTRDAHRLSVRSFYRWAVQAGHVDLDPTEPLNQRARALDVPKLWRPELNAYRRHLRSGGRAESTVQQHMKALGRFARANPSLAPFDVTLDDLLEYTGAKKWAVETRRATRTVLRSFYRWASDTGRIENNAADHLPVIKSAQPRPNPARESEYRAALNIAAPRERLALRLAAELGLRCAEVAVSHSRDLEQHGEHWVLLVHGKGDKQRRLPLTADLAATLRARSEGYFFPGNDAGHLSPRYMSKRISALLPQGVSMHALRHRFATRAYSVDRDVFTVQQLLGHASPATTQRYVLVQDDAMRRLVESVSNGAAR